MEHGPNEAKRSSRFARVVRKLRRTEAGQALVEFTMILPIFLMLLFGLVDFGRGFYTWLLITNAAREGARVAAVQGDSSAINTRIYDSFCDNYPSSCGLDPAKLTINKTNVQGARGSAVEIDLSYNFDYATPLGNIVAMLGGSLSEPTITAHTSMRLE
ncbi:TadE/TadG family type IV pilus assembly protein [Candidatus Amarobacter glycogenicus]|jgi:Flp pilus assembly protein TadG|uniref:TadE/TadG family type IV pilus assembly protein n=1 Tax=Candidatus Amarobacter glycogenicus TaxID=3140699 RepID=UPI002A0DBE50|nr:pilus assembly protein [Dehalococcoidia bacterium]MBK9545377.1 pilus assembly protein [Dehalococcoidia bacterium]MBK9611850.1 pilus assembly protein [Dehalococcoidia bacterium]MCC6266659.1 pilus assembly protein [Dehalococcoidia bacterium]